ncbi:protein of unknown function [Pararobbsia alpina]
MRRYASAQAQSNTYSPYEWSLRYSGVAATSSSPSKLVAPIFSLSPRVWTTPSSAPFSSLALSATCATCATFASSVSPCPFFELLPVVRHIVTKRGAHPVSAVAQPAVVSALRNSCRRKGVGRGCFASRAFHISASRSAGESTMRVR